MSNPSASQRHLITKPRATRGVVVEVSGGVAKVATARGLAEYAIRGQVNVGDQVQVDSDGNAAKKGQNAQAHWL
ncbi:MAG: hypothetical protein OEV92_00315 [Nitrospinota bacterium]|nr:hypothetical protein [Nitrospinota bacterium]